MSGIRAIIADDEAFARQHLRELCALEPDISIVGEADHSAEAIRQVQQEKPDLLLLDVRMRDTNGFAVLQRLKDDKPLVVFVTADQQHALEAFAVDAVDYLLKPLDRERFRRAIERVRTRLAGTRSAGLADQISNVVRQTVIATHSKSSPGSARRIVAQRDGRMFFIPQTQIDCVEADRNYVILRRAEESYTLRWTMQEAQEALDPEMFLRVHRSVIVNTHRVREMSRGAHGEYLITLENGLRFASGRSYRREIQAHLRNSR
jgi:two-component system, LytTR family, response regulator